MAPRVVVFNNMITPYTNRLYNELVARGMDLAVLSCSVQEPDRQWAHSIAPLYRCKTVSGFSLPLNRSRFTHVNFGISRALRALDPDILIVNGFFPSMLAAAAWAKANSRILALTIDGWAETMPNTIYHRLVRPWLLGKCEAIICCSSKGQAYFHDQGIAAEQITLVPLVPPWDAPAQAISYHDRRFDILWCARINDDAKNAVFFESVVSELHKRRPGISVRVVGSGPAEKRMMARFAAQKIDVSHDSYVPWDTMADVFQQSRIMMLPSLLEPWGLVCNEAMQCGVPCIVSRHVGAAGELVRHDESGLVCDLVVEEWVDCAEEFLESPGRWTAISTSARLAAASTTLSASADAFSSVIDRLTRRPVAAQGAAYA